MAGVLQRRHAVLAGLLLCCLSGGLSIPDPRQREALIRLEASRQTGGGLVLSGPEKLLDARLSQMKQEETMRPNFLPAMHFFKAKNLIRTSPVFSVLQKMPKGNPPLSFTLEMTVILLSPSFQGRLSTSTTSPWWTWTGW